MSAEIRGSRQAEILGTLAGWAIRLWSRTLHFHITDHCGLTRPGTLLGPVIYAMWHSRICVIPPLWARTVGKSRQAVVLTSASKDGTILSSAMAVFKIGAIRGSSSRRAVAALIGMKRALRDGQDVCITPDGPRGPRYLFEPGIIKLAESSGAPIVPIHATFSAAWRLKTWDRLVIPKPFSHVQITFGEIVNIPPKLDPAAFQAHLNQLQSLLIAGTDDA